MTADRNDTRKRLEAVAADVRLHIATWSHGDGATRYRFIDTHGLEADAFSTAGELDYFAGGPRQLYTALGLAEAWAWLRGYLAGASQESTHGFTERSARYRREHAA